MKAINLRTEYLKNPLGIDYKRPRLSWTCQEGIRQTAYQIIAKDDQGRLLWDSGKVESDQMHLVLWKGPELTSRQVVVWNVTLWDQANVPGPVSSDASFELGLLAEDDWKASWITGAYKVNKKTRYPVDCFVKNFELQPGKKVQKARAYMTACGVYEGSLNGRKMGDFCLAPGITDYRKRVQYQTADITDLLKEGKNQLTFMLADGWYRGSVGAWGMKNYYGSETKLLAQIEITYEDGTFDRVVTDDSFLWTSQGPIRFADNKDGEIYHAPLEDWADRVEEDRVNPDAGYQKAKVTSHNVVPSASNNFPLTEHERLTNPEVIKTPSGKTVWNFRQNIAGYLEFTVKAAEGDRIFLRFGEKLDDAGEFTQKNIQCVNKKTTTPLQQVEYICKDGVNHYKTRFAIFGFQYVEVTGDVEIQPDQVTAIAVYSDFETTFRFDSSNQLLNQFVDNTLWSLKNNSADLPTDCPTRERHGWSGDAQLFVNTASYMVNYGPFARKYENDLVDWQKPNGCFPQIAPEGGTDPYMRTMNGSTGWADAGVLIPYRLYKKYGDEEILRRYYKPMRKYAVYMMNRSQHVSPMISERTGLNRSDRKYLYNNGQHYGEWAEPKDVHELTWKDFMTSQPEVATAYLSYVMSVMSEIAEILDLSKDKALYDEFAQGSRRTYQKLVELPKYSLDTDRQAKLVRPLYFNLLTESQTEFARKRLLEAMESYGWRVGTGFLSTPLILYVLEEIDLEAAYRLLENEEKPGWLYMPKVGATSIWEDWEGPDSDNGAGGGIASLDHYSKGAVCEWVFDQMCGVAVDGENHFRIAPHPGGHFTYADFSYDSVYGSVRCKWVKKADGTFAHEINVPANTSATVQLPGCEAVVVEAGVYKY